MKAVSGGVHMHGGLACHVSGQPLCQSSLCVRAAFVSSVSFLGRPLRPSKLAVEGEGEPDYSAQRCV